MYEPPNCDIYHENFGADHKKQLETIFEQNCKNRISCFFPLNETIIPPTCNYSKAKQHELVYFMRANCMSEKIIINGDHVLDISKNDVAIIIVMMDIFIAAFFYGSFLYLRIFERITVEEIEGSIVSANDFTV